MSATAVNSEFPGDLAIQPRKTFANPAQLTAERGYLAATVPCQKFSLQNLP